jgi:RNA polymerase sigma-70 factor (family 1)
MFDYQAYSDMDLFRLVAKDDERAYRTLYDRYWNKLLVQAMLKLRVEEEVEEILQDIFLNLWRRRKTIQIKNTFHTYIASIVKYEILRQLAKQKAKNTLEGKVSALTTVEDNTTQDWLDFEDLRDQIEASVCSLPEKCQLVFRLSREKGLTEKEIAGALHIAPKTVEAHIGKALKILRSSLAGLSSVFFSLMFFFLRII